MGPGFDVPELKGFLGMTDTEKESCNRYRFAFEFAPVGIVWHDKEGKIIDVNPYAAEKLGYSPAELAGNYLYKFVVLNTREQKPYYDEVFPNIEKYTLFTKHGKVIPVMVSVFGAPPGQGDFGCAFFLDISDKITLLETLQQLEKAAGLTSKSRIATREMSPGAVWDRFW